MWPTYIQECSPSLTVGQNDHDSFFPLFPSLLFTLQLINIHKKWTVVCIISGNYPHNYRLNHDLLPGALVFSVFMVLALFFPFLFFVDLLCWLIPPTVEWWNLVFLAQVSLAKKKRIPIVLPTAIPIALLPLFCFMIRLRGLRGDHSQ